MSFASKSLLTLVLASVPGMAATSCESLASLSLPDATITSVQSVAAGAFTPPNDNGKISYKDLPAFCRVMATLKPSSDSDIKVEVWLPAAGWNKKYQAVGNGGWAGVISYSELADALRGGYATSSTDTGHVGGSGSFALGHPEKLTDFAWRSEHEMTVKSKAVIEAFYGAAPRLSYWNGCSTGGRQGLKEAQRFPDDFDAVIAGAPANRTALALWVASANRKDSPGYIPPAKYPVVHQAALEACDAQDGLKDGLIGNPAKCKFDPKVIECKGGDGPNCLTSAQVETARKIYSNGTNPRTGQILFPSYPAGSELGWYSDPSRNIVDQYKYVAFRNPDWDWRTFDFDKDFAASEKPEYLPMNATDPNLSKFFGHNGKLLLYHGWADTNVSPYLTIQYYKSVVDTMGGEKKAADSVRLFLEPGMGHCGGGEGPNKFDKVKPMEAWVEKGAPPEKIIASHATAGKVDRTRPLCPYPQVAKYKGSGSIDDAASFSCAAGL